jgi:hypothetical protein
MSKCYYNDKTAEFMYGNGYCDNDCSECTGIGIPSFKRVTVKVASAGEEGNIYFILSKVREAMRKADLIQAYNDLRDDVTKRDSYSKAIARIRRDVDLIDTDGRI